MLSADNYIAINDVHIKLWITLMNNKDFTMSGRCAVLKWFQDNPVHSKKIVTKEQKT